jgi:hypothetical protein
MYLDRVEVEKFSRPFIMDIMRQFTVNDLDNKIQFRVINKTHTTNTKVAQTQLKIND